MKIRSTDTVIKHGVLNARFSSVESELIGEILRFFQQRYPDLRCSSEELNRHLSQPPKMHFGDWALPCFPFAKKLRRSPKVLADSLVEFMNAALPTWLERVTSVQGFVNFFIDRSCFAKTVLTNVVSDDWFVNTPFLEEQDQQTVMVEFSQPNTHKEFHIGHARNACLGESICRIFRQIGHRVIALNYFGDQGSHVAKCLWHLERSSDTSPSHHRAEWLGKHYCRAVEEIHSASEEEKLIWQREISAILAKLEKKQSHYHALWEKTREWCLQDFAAIYRWLGIHFDRNFFESDFSVESQTMSAEYFRQGLFIEDDGAIGMDLADCGLGFFMLRKSDGNSLYAAKDLALARRKFADYKLDLSINIVANEQKLYFQQVFETLHRLNIAQRDQNYHLSYGMVRLPEGKMSSRRGNTIPFSELRRRTQEELEPFLKKYEDEWTDEQRKSTIDSIAAASIQCGMLQVDPLRDVVFDLKEWLDFDGQTATYLLYTYARIAAVFRKAEGISSRSLPEEASVYLSLDLEHQILQSLYRFPKTVYNVARELKPSLLAHELFALAKMFNRYYVEVSVLKEQVLEVRRARLCFLLAVQRTLKQGLNLLGIETIEQM